MLRPEEHVSSVAPTCEFSKEPGIYIFPDISSGFLKYFQDASIWAKYSLFVNSGVAFGIQMVTSEHEEGPGPGMGLGQVHWRGSSPVGWAGEADCRTRWGRDGGRAGHCIFDWDPDRPGRRVLT